MTLVDVSVAVVTVSEVVIVPLYIGLKWRQTTKKLTRYKDSPSGGRNSASKTPKSCLAKYFEVFLSEVHFIHTWQVISQHRVDTHTNYQLNFDSGGPLEWGLDK